jgi:Uma2 family endonuclease
MQFTLDQLGSPLRVVPPEPLSVEQFWRFGEANPDLRMELEPNGDVIVMTPTSRGTGFRGSLITAALGYWAQQDGRGYGFDSSTAFVLPDGSVRSPDAAWVSDERWNPSMEDDYKTVLCPEFVIELRSKSDSLAATQTKMREWIKNGVQLAWLIDPQRKVVEVYRGGSARADVLEGVTSVYGEGPVGGFILEMAKIWG